MNAAVLERALHDLEGKKVWSMGVAPELGAAFLLRAGEHWRVPASHLKNGFREDGEVHLYVPCAWQLEQEGDVELSSAQIWATDDGWAEALEEFEGQTIASVDLASAAREIALTFSGPRRLRIFGDRSESEVRTAFYDFSTGKSARFMVFGDRIELMERFSPAELEGLQTIE